MNRVRSIIGFDDLRSEARQTGGRSHWQLSRASRWWTDVQPMRAFDDRIRRAPTATMNSSCPDRSKRRARSLHAPRRSTKVREEDECAMSELTQKIAPPHWSTSRPPSVGPVVVPMLAMAVQIDGAHFLRLRKAALTGGERGYADGRRTAVPRAPRVVSTAIEGLPTRRR